MQYLADISTFNAICRAGQSGFSGGCVQVSVFNRSLPPLLKYVNWDKFKSTITDIRFILRNLGIAEEEGDERRVEIYSKKIAGMLDNVRWNYDILRKYIDELGVSLEDWEARFGDLG